MRIFIFVLLLLSGSLLTAQDQMFEVCPLKIGEEVPLGKLKDSDAKEHTLADLMGETPSVLIFYRGAWCGYCTKHLAELNEVKEDMELLGYQVFGITVDQASKLEESTARSESEIPVYSDSDLELIKGFGLNWQVETERFEQYKEKYDLNLEVWSGEAHHALPVPAIFVVKDGVVEFQYVNPNYRKRLKPQTLLAILKTL